MSIAIAVIKPIANAVTNWHALRRIFSNSEKWFTIANPPDSLIVQDRSGTNAPAFSSPKGAGEAVLKVPDRGGRSQPPESSGSLLLQAAPQATQALQLPVSPIHH